MIKTMSLWFLMAAAAAAGAGDGAWRLVFADEFNEDGRPDPKNWTFEQGFVRNEELQWYQPENAFCEEGRLIIEGRREDRPNPGFRAGGKNWKSNREGAHYTSSSLTTRGRHTWQYGRFEVRAKVVAQNKQEIEGFLAGRPTQEGTTR